MGEAVPPSLVVRADARPGAGLGHLMRCYALAEAAAARGAAVRLVCEPLPGRVERMLAEAGVDWLPASAPGAPLRESLAAAGRLAAADDLPWVVLDGYGYGPETRAAVGRAGFPLLLLDDTATLGPYRADLVLNQNPGAEELAYPDLPAERLLRGPRYHLLRREVRQAQRRTRHPRLARRLLVMMGGTDPDDATGAVLRALAGSGEADLEVLVVVGAAYPHGERLARAAGHAPLAVRVVRQPPDLPELLAEVELAVTGAGSTSLELAFLGIPALLLVLADNQARAAEALARRGIARVAEPGTLAGLVGELRRDRGTRAGMGRRGREACDGRGPERVLAALARAAGRDPGSAARPVVRGAREGS